MFLGHNLTISNWELSSSSLISVASRIHSNSPCNHAGQLYRCSSMIWYYYIITYAETLMFWRTAGHSILYCPYRVPILWALFSWVVAPSSPGDTWHLLQLHIQARQSMCNRSKTSRKDLLGVTHCSSFLCAHTHLKPLESIY